MVVSAEECPRIADSVLISIPFSMPLVAKIWRSPWNGMCLHPARSRRSESLLRQLVGLLGLVLSSGDGNTHSESTVFLYSLKILATDCGILMVRTDAFVFGVLTIYSEPSVVYSRLTLSSQVSKLMSSQRNPSNSPRRSPEASARRIIS